MFNVSSVICAGGTGGKRASLFFHRASLSGQLISSRELKPSSTTNTTIICFRLSRRSATRGRSACNIVRGTANHNCSTYGGLIRSAVLLNHSNADERKASTADGCDETPRP